LLPRLELGADVPVYHMTPSPKLPPMVRPRSTVPSNKDDGTPALNVDPSNSLASVEEFGRILLIAWLLTDRYYAISDTPLLSRSQT